MCVRGKWEVQPELGVMVRGVAVPVVSGVDMDGDAVAEAVAASLSICVAARAGERRVLVRFRVCLPGVAVAARLRFPPPSRRLPSVEPRVEQVLVVLDAPRESFAGRSGEGTRLLRPGLRLHSLVGASLCFITPRSSCGGR